MRDSRKNYDLLNWANRINSKDYHAITNRDKRGIPVPGPERLVQTCLHSVKCFGRLKDGYTGRQAGEWATWHRLMEHDSNNQPVITQAGEVYLEIFPFSPKRA